MGHAASGKSEWAEREVRAAARAEGRRPTYLATARAGDREVAVKVAAHAARRGDEWDLVEEPVDLTSAAAALDGPVLIDCLTMWLTNMLPDGDRWEENAQAWLDKMADADSARFWLVSNDVGGGVTPANALARRFQRMQGLLNQRVAARADRVVLVTAGLAQELK